MTIAEYRLLVRGTQERKRLRKRDEAFWVASLMNATGNYKKKPITVDFLTGEGPTVNREDLKKRAAARQARLRRQRERLKKQQATRGDSPDRR